jgi:hypothetical protein
MAGCYERWVVVVVVVVSRGVAYDEEFLQFNS